MPAPTAVIKHSDQEDAAAIPLPDNFDEEETAGVSLEAMDLDTTPQLKEKDTLFAPAKEVPRALRVETRKVPVSPQRFTPVKASWNRIYTPLVSELKLQVRMNVKTKSIELRTSKFTTDIGALQKGEDFVKAFAVYGFDLDDAMALLRVDDLYIQSFQISDVKTLNGAHTSRAIGRLCGKDGKTKFVYPTLSYSTASLEMVV
jgi:RNA-binding protein PNO1